MHPSNPRKVPDAAHGAGRSKNPTVAYHLTGPVRWFDRELDRIVVHVAEADGHAGRFLGEDVTVALPPSRQAYDLVPGDEVAVRCRLPRELGAATPELLEALAVERVAEPL